MEFLLQKFRVIGNQGVRMKITDEVPSLTLVTHPSPSQEGIFFSKRNFRREVQRKSFIFKKSEVPEDVKVSGFDNIEIGSYMNPTLSTVSVNWKEYGAMIARLALDILNHKEVGPVQAPVQIIERESSKIS